MKFTSLNNATVIIESNNQEKLIIDPWLIGNLYFNSWKPSYKLTEEGKSLLKDLDYLFISHIHQDHWDLETITFFKKNIKIFLPNLPFLKKVIGDKLLDLGFSNIKYIDLLKDTRINPQITFSIIPPLNSFGQEEEEYLIDKDNIISIDTSILINDHSEKVSHILLCDNTPYCPDSSKIVFKANNYNYPISTLWYPYNGSAHDYPLCYDNFDLEEKKNIVEKMFLVRNKNIINLVQDTNSCKAIPYSSDFIFSGKREKEFNEIFSEQLSRSFSKEFNNKLSKSRKFLHLKQGYSIFTNGSDYKTFKSKFVEENPKKAISRDKPKNKNFSLEVILKSLEDAFLSSKKRYSKKSLELPNIPFFIFVEDLENTLECNLKDNKFKQTIYTNEKLEIIFNEYILLSISSENLYFWLNGIYHIDNLTISGCLTWYRKTKNNTYPRDFYNFLNFFHI